MDGFLRWSGGCWIGAGLLILPTVAHPDIFDVGLAAASLQTYWAVGHAAGLLVVVLSLFGLAGLAVSHRARLGRLGVMGLVGAVVGLVAAAGLAAVEALVFPPLARAAPELLAFDGPIAGSWWFRALGGLALLWLLGSVLLGIAVEQAGVLPRGRGALFATGAFAFAAFAGPFVPVLEIVGIVLLAVAHAWSGAALVVGRRASASPLTATPPPGPPV